MSRIYRGLLGLSVVTLLVPATIVAFPDLLDRGGPSADGTTVVAGQDHEHHLDHLVAEPVTSTASDSLAMDRPTDPEIDDLKLPRVTAEGATTEVTEADHADHAPGTGSHQTTTTAKQGSGGDGSGGGGSSTSPIGDIITGNACPCTVTGTATLQGKINLKGDLIVDGGTLIARSGVDLEGNGHQILFQNGGKADFQGSPTSTWSGNGSNQNLKRDINFNNLRRLMFHMRAGPSTLKYFTVSNSGTSALGDYPLHWHLNGNSTRGTIVEGVVVVNGKHHAFVPHGSHGITFRETIAKNTRGDAYWWDDPGTNESCQWQSDCTLDNSNDITYDRALADGVTNGPGDNRGFLLAGFHLGAGKGNKVVNSVAININPSHVVNCSGFHWPESANQNAGGNVWQFSNNRSTSSSGCAGIFVWQNDGNRHVVNGFVGGGIDHGAYSNNYDYRNVDVPYVIVHASGWKVTGGKIGTVYAAKHVSSYTPTAVFQDVKVGSLVIENGGDGGSIPGHYVFKNTGLTCSAVVYSEAAPGTKVTIDGSDC